MRNYTKKLVAPRTVLLLIAILSLVLVPGSAAAEEVCIEFQGVEYCGEGSSSSDSSSSTDGDGDFDFSNYDDLIDSYFG